MDRKTILARIEEWLERYVDAESLFEKPARPVLPDETDGTVQALEDVERVALDLRSAWNLGLDPIENLIDGLIEGNDGFDATAFCIADDAPVIVANKNSRGDRQLVSMSHEKGWDRLEPGDQIPPEQEPSWSKRLVMRALTEELIIRSACCLTAPDGFVLYCSNHETLHAQSHNS